MITATEEQSKIKSSHGFNDANPTINEHRKLDLLELAIIG